MKMNDIKSSNQTMAEEMDKLSFGFSTILRGNYVMRELSFSGETSTYESADDMSRSRNEDGYWSGAELSNVELGRLCTAAGASPLRSKQLSEALTQMDSYILKKSAHGFVFSHAWTSEVVAKVLAELDETTFIVHCSLKYLEHVRLEPNEVADFDYAIIVHQTGANTLLKDKYGRTSFLIAALVGSVSILELSLKTDHRCINHCDAFGNTALHLAAIKGQTEVIKLLLKEGLDIQKGNMDRMTPLHIAATNGRYSVVDPLLSIERNSATSRQDGKRFVRGVSVDLKDIHGMAPIHYAAMWGYEYVLGRLLQNKSEVNLMTEKSETALHLATQGSHIETVQSFSETRLIRTCLMGREELLFTLLPRKDI
ncbi:ankyrin-1-like [Haliotis rubra]|uniref:ankyrin-1-like n=1 Tax=Haliotis rubra TaxID=36100 RepID=UPI001EE50D7E|nr:ankyrin-1-like [Haliotis rubra]